MNSHPSQPTGPQPSSHHRSPAGLGAALLGIAGQPLYWLLAAIPLAVGLEWFHAGDLWIFIVSGLAIIPLAGLMGRATENLAETMGAGIGGLLNATFGNAAELIIALIALSKGPAMYPLVKASITGSIIGNILLVLGLSVHIAVGSGIQIALFVAPALVFASMLMGHAQPLDLHFTVLETLTILLSVGVLALVCQDGESHWMEGVMLLGVYLIVALAFYHLPEGIH